MELSTRFDFSSVDHSKNNTVHLVVSMTAPEIDWVSQRPKLCILPVLDVSGSMSGQKLNYAKSSIRKLIEQLTPGDLAGFIIFSSTVTVVVDPAPVTAEHKTKLLTAVDRTVCRGDTNLLGALQDAVQVIRNLDLSRNFLQRVILFTDGEPTVGITDKGAIKTSFAETRGHVSVSFFGYGSAGGMYHSCDQNFLMELSQLGEGNYAYVQNPDDSLSAFGKELGGLLSTYASNIKLTVTPLKGHKVLRVISDLKSEMDVTGEYVVDVGDIFAEETRHVVLEVELQSQPKAFPRDSKVLEVLATYLQSTQTGNASEKVLAAAQVRFARPNAAQTEPDVKVDEIVAIHQMVRSQLEAEEKAKQGQYAAAQLHMEETSKKLFERGRVNVAYAAQNVSTRLADASAYTSSQGYLKSMQYGSSRGMGASAVSADALEDLSLCAVKLNNSAQENYVSSFTTPVVTSLITPEEDSEDLGRPPSRP